MAPNSALIEMSRTWAKAACKVVNQRSSFVVLEAGLSVSLQDFQFGKLVTHSFDVPMGPVSM